MVFADLDLVPAAPAFCKFVKFQLPAKGIRAAICLSCQTSGDVWPMHCKKYPQILR